MWMVGSTPGGCRRDGERVPLDVAELRAVDKQVLSLRVATSKDTGLGELQRDTFGFM